MAEVLQFMDEKTEKRILEQKLKESDIKYRDLFENASDSIYIYDTGGYFKEVNNTALKLLGCTREEIIGTHISKWITPESLKLTRESLKKCIAGEPVKQPMVLEVICKNGEHRLMEIRRRLIKDGDRVIAVHGIGRDITEKRRMELQLKEYHEKLENSYEELKASEARYRELFDNAIDAMYTQDLEGRLLTINDTGLKIIGCTRDELIGSHFSRWLTPESLKIGQEVLAKALAGENIRQPTMVEIVCKNGEHKFVEFTIRLIKEGDRLTGIHGIGRDVTENKRLKKEIKESNKQLKLLWYLLAGTRGGSTRALILRRLIDRPYNANQLSEALNLDYKTIRHHLDVLIKNGIIAKESEGHTAIYFLSKSMEANLNEFDREFKQ